MPDVMLDIETMNTESDAATLSIAGVPFDGKTHECDTENIFYEKVDPAQYDTLELSKKFSIGAKTMMFWMSQPKKARLEAFSGSKELAEVLRELTAWFTKINPKGEKMRVWAHGKDFDCVILANAYKAMGMEVPWQFWLTMDTRTAYHLAPGFVKPEFNGDYPKHHPVGDCIAQIEALKKAAKRNAEACAEGESPTKRSKCEE